MKTKLTELLGIQYPIIQGAMAWTSEHTLAAAIANAGATGVIATGGRDTEWVRQEIRQCTSLTDKPFGAGNPVPFIEPLHAAGIKVIPVVPNVKLAKRVASAGADAIIIEGQEAGGHIGTQTTMALLENVVPEVDIPVVIAGGIVDGRGLAAGLTMGASGVQMGSRFILAEECKMHQNCKDAIINATDTDSTVTGLTFNHGVRGLKSEFTARYLEAEYSCAPKSELTAMAIGTNKKAAVDGDIVNGVVQVGQGLNRLTQVEPAKTIVESVVAEAKEAIKQAQQFI